MDSFLSRFSFVALLIGVIFGCSLVFLFQDASLLSQSHLMYNKLFTDSTNTEINLPQSLPDQNDNNIQSNAVFKVQDEGVGLDEKVRVLCWILTSPDNYATKAKAVKETWGKRCNILLFMSTTEDASLPAIKLNVGEGRDNLWGKTREAFRYVWNNYKDKVDWFYKADDDTYAIMENMRYFLSAYNASKPMWFGHKFKTIVEQGYFSGGAGYVLSKEAARRFVEEGYFNALICRHDHQGAEDAEMGKCMSNLNVSSMDTRDSKGRGRFFPFFPESHIFPGKVTKDYWFWTSLYYPAKDGLDCCSDTAISFHYINMQQMYLLEYLIYQLSPFGYKSESRPLTPEPPPDLELTATPWSVPDDPSVQNDTSTTTTETAITTLKTIEDVTTTIKTEGSNETQTIKPTLAKQ